MLAEASLVLNSKLLGGKGRVQKGGDAGSWRVFYRETSSISSNWSTVNDNADGKWIRGRKACFLMWGRTNTVTLSWEGIDVKAGVPQTTLICSKLKKIDTWNSSYNEAWGMHKERKMQTSLVAKVHSQFAWKPCLFVREAHARTHIHTHTHTWPREKPSDISCVILWTYKPTYAQKTCLRATVMLEQWSSRNTACHHILNPNWAISIIIHLYCFNSK